MQLHIAHCAPGHVRDISTIPGLQPVQHTWDHLSQFEALSSQHVCEDI